MTLREFWTDLSQWSQATFGTDKERGPVGPLKHLAKEVAEAQEKPDDIYEYADMVFLVFDAARRAGFEFDQLTNAVEHKLQINRARKWGPKSTDGVTEHVREANDETT